MHLLVSTLETGYVPVSLEKVPSRDSGESFLLTAQRQPQTFPILVRCGSWGGFLFKWPLPPQAEEMYSLQNKN
jgi:hypothetical protein